MSSIFISHSSKDNKAAESLREKLLEAGHRGIFLDFDPADGIPAGKNWEQELYAQLRGCQAVIVLCTTHSMKSPWCFAEITHARALGKALFPIKIADCEIVGLLNDVQVTDYTSLGEEETYTRLWRGLKQAGLDPKDAFDWDNSRPPYPGLLAFEAEDAAIYFGRNDDIREGLGLLNRLRTFGGTRLTLVLGASGSGKSSLVKAGILPRLKKDQQNWIVLDPFRRQKDPFAELANVIDKGFQDCHEAEVEATYRDKWLDETEVEARVESLMSNLDKLSSLSKQKQATVLLTIDQFEELLGNASENQNSDFLAFLETLLRHPDASVMVLGTLRSDFLGTFQTHPILQNLDFEPLTVHPLGHESIAQVIQGPADVAGLELETGLVELLVKETQSGNALPLLAFTLRELWEYYGDDNKLEIAEYRQLGGLQGSVSQAAQTILDGYCSPRNPQRPVLEKNLCYAFLKLVRIDDEGKAVRRQARWQDLSSSVHTLLEKFVQGRLLKSSGDDQNRLLEVSHETIFTAWPLLQKWIEESRDQLREKQKIEAAAQEWQSSGQKTDYLLSKKRLKEAKDFQKEEKEKYPLSQLATDFVNTSIKYQRREKIKAWGLFLIIPLIGTVFGGYLIIKEIQLNSDKKLIIDCQGKSKCPGRVVALERLVQAEKSLKSYNLSGAHLTSANLTGANLTEAILASTILIDANLTDANLYRAHLINAILTVANLSGANLTSANLTSANLTGANLTSVNLKGAFLGGVNLTGVNLTSANFTDANFTDASLEGANLSNANFTYAQNLTNKQIKLACNWEQAYFARYRDQEKKAWVVDEEEQQTKIKELEEDKTSDPQEKPDCTRWKEE